MNSLLLFGMPGESGLVFIILVFILPGILWLFALIDVLRSEFKNSSNKVIWLLLILLLPLFGAILYLLIGRNQKS